MGSNITKGNANMNYIEPNVLSTNLELILQGVFLKDIETNKDFEVNQTFFKLSEETIIKFLNSKIPTSITFPVSVISVRVGDPNLEKDEDRHRTRVHQLISETLGNIHADDDHAHRSTFKSISLQLNIKGVYPMFLNKDFEKLIHKSLDVHSTELASEFTHALTDNSIEGKIERILYVAIRENDIAGDNTLISNKAKEGLSQTDLILMICFTCITSLFLLLQIQRVRSSVATNDKSGFCTIPTTVASSSYDVSKLFGRKKSASIEIPTVQHDIQPLNTSQTANVSTIKPLITNDISTTREVSVSEEISVASSITKSTFFGGSHFRNRQNPHRWNVMMAKKSIPNDNQSKGSRKSFRAMSWTNLLFSTRNVLNESDKVFETQRSNVNASIDQENNLNIQEEEYKQDQYQATNTINNGHLHMNPTQHMNDDMVRLKYGGNNFTNGLSSSIQNENFDNNKMPFIKNQRRYSLPNQSTRIYQIQGGNTIERPPMRKSFSSFSSILKNELQRSSQMFDTDDRSEDLNALWEPEVNRSPENQKEEVGILENMLRQESKVLRDKSFSVLTGEQEESDNHDRTININKRLSMESSVSSIQDSHQNRSQTNSIGLERMNSSNRGSRSASSGDRKMVHSSSRESLSASNENGNRVISMSKRTLSSNSRIYSIHNSNRSSITTEKTGTRSSDTNNRRTLLSANSKTSSRSSKSTRFRSLIRGDSFRRLVQKKRRYSSSDLKKNQSDRNMLRTRSENMIPSHISVLARSVGSRNLLATDSVTNAHIPKTLMESKYEQNNNSDDSTITTIDSNNRSIQHNLLDEKSKVLSKENAHFGDNETNLDTLQTSANNDNKECDRKHNDHRKNLNNSRKNSNNKPPRQLEKGVNGSKTGDHTRKPRGFSSDLPLKKNYRQDARNGGIHRIPSEISVVSRSSSSRNLLATSTKNHNMEKVIEDENNFFPLYNENWKPRKKSTLSSSSKSASKRLIRTEQMPRQESMSALLSRNQSDLLIESDSSEKSSLTESKSGSINSSISSLNNESTTRNKAKHKETSMKTSNSPRNGGEINSSKGRSTNIKSTTADRENFEEQKSAQNRGIDSSQKENHSNSFTNESLSNMRGHSRNYRHRSISEADIIHYRSSYERGDRFSEEWQRSKSASYTKKNHSPHETQSTNSKTAKEIRAERRKERIRKLSENSLRRQDDCESLLSRTSHSRDLLADISVTKSKTSSKVASSERGLSKYLIEQRKNLHKPDTSTDQKHDDPKNGFLVQAKEKDQESNSLSPNQRQRCESSKKMREELRKERLRKFSQRTMPLLSSQISRNLSDNEALISRQSNSRHLLTDKSDAKPMSSLYLSTSERGISSFAREQRRSSLDSEFSLDFGVDDTGKESLEKLLKNESKKLDMRIKLCSKKDNGSKDWSPDVISKILNDGSDDGSTQEYLEVFDPTFKKAQELLKAKEETSEVDNKSPEIIKRKRKLSLPLLQTKSSSLKGMFVGRGKSDTSLKKDTSYA